MLPVSSPPVALLSLEGTASVLVRFSRETETRGCVHIEEEIDCKVRLPRLWRLTSPEIGQASWQAGDP